jgi:hypothetical protein
VSPDRAREITTEMREIIRSQTELSARMRRMAADEAVEWGDRYKAIVYSDFALELVAWAKETERQAMKVAEER